MKHILQKVTWRTMQQNRIRTMVTILGVVLSTALFTAVIVFGSSAMNYLYRTYTYEEGTAHIVYQDGTTELYDQIKEDARIERISAVTTVGYDRMNGRNGGVPYICLASGEVDFLNDMSVRLVAGHMPQTADEVVIPSTLLRLEETAYAIGNEIRLDLGLRVIEEGYGWNNEYCEYNTEIDKVLGEHFEELENGTYSAVITGVYDAYYTKGAAYLVMTCNQKPMTDASIMDLYITLKNPAKELDAFCREHFGADYRTRWMEIEINDELMMYEGNFEYANEGYFVLFLAGIVIALIALGSFMLIYSAFSISVSERTKQFGLLASIGTSRKQIHRMVIAEALTVAGIGIPAGIAIGVIGMWITLIFIGDKFGEFKESVYRLDLHVNLWILLIAAGIALLTIVLSAWIPAKRAAGVSAIETIRQNKDIRMKERPIKVSRLFRKHFGMEGVIAKKYYKRDRKKYRVTVLSLTVSVMLVLSVSGLTMQLNNWIEMYDAGTVDVSTWLDYNVAEAAMDEISSLGTVDEVSAYHGCGYFDFYKDEDKISQEYYQSDISGMMSVYYIDTLTYEKLLKEYGYEHAWKHYQKTGGAMGIVINCEDYVDYRIDADGNISRFSAKMTWLKDGVTELLVMPELPVIWADEDGGEIYLARTEWVESDNEQMIVRAEYVSGEGEPVGTWDYEPEILSVGGLLDEPPLGLGEAASTRMRILYPFSVCEVFEINGEIAQVQVSFKTSDSQKLIEDVICILEAHDVFYDGNDFADKKSEEAERRNTALVIRVFSSGFLVLISLIAAVNVFNTISTNLILRKRDFAMLASIGMTENQKRRMLYYECQSCVIRAILWGGAAGIGVLMLIKRTFSLVIEEVALIPWHAIVVMAAGMFVIVALTMRYSLKRLENEALISVLRKEAV